MNLNSIWSALEESQDILGDYAYPAMDQAAEALSLPSVISLPTRLRISLESLRRQFKTNKAG